MSNKIYPEDDFSCSKAIAWLVWFLWIYAIVFTIGAKLYLNHKQLIDNLFANIKLSS